LTKTLDRRELLLGAAGAGAFCALPRGVANAAAKALEPGLFAAARKDDRGTFSAALFSLDGGDVRAVELPERGHDIALRPGTTEWVAFARRPGRLKNYIGSVAADASGTVVAASAPKGGVITYWDASARAFLGTCALNDGCGIAPTRHRASFLLTSGEGWLATGDPKGALEREA
jgi:hypothetical protein